LSTEPHRPHPPVSPWRAGLACKCPRCGEGKLFAGFLKLAEQCPVCGQSFKGADPGDGPAFFVMFIVGAIVVAGAVVVEVLFEPAYWVHVVLWVPAVFALSAVLLRPAKALLVAFQFKNRLHDFSDTAS
jgi:uncharacterized protein (DUF983 family)